MREQKNEVQKKHKKSDERIIYFMYIVTLAFIVLYILHNDIVTGIIAFLAIIFTIVLEFRGSIRSEGMKKTARDLIIAIVAVVVVIWVLPTIFLQSSSPIDVVASCSMLPTLQRGDLAFVHGISNMSQFLKENNVPVVNVSTTQFSNMISNINNEYDEPFAYLHNDIGDVVIAQYLNSSIHNYSVGLYNVPCINKLLGEGASQLLARCYVNQSVQSENLIKYSYSVGSIQVGQNTFAIPEITSISVANTTIVENYSNPIIIYTTIPGDSFYTDYEIIHRLYAAINVNGRYYMITKGDNNPVIDIQAGNYPANTTQVIGYLVARVPYLGYPSLIIKGQLSPIAQCNQTMLR